MPRSASAFIAAWVPISHAWKWPLRSENGCGASPTSGWTLRAKSNGRRVRYEGRDNCCCSERPAEALRARPGSRSKAARRQQSKATAVSIIVVEVPATAWRGPSSSFSQSSSRPEKCGRCGESRRKSERRGRPDVIDWCCTIASEAIMMNLILRKGVEEAA
jgi:hypothetical protein